MKDENLTVEQIMERIRKNLRERRGFVEERNSDSEFSFLEPLKWEDLPADLDKKEYQINDFLKYHDKEFVRFTYRAILKREPDPSGYDNYLSKLRFGRLDKIDIVVSICKSPEGRSKGVKVKNINYYYLRCGIKRIPIISYFIRWINALLKLPKRINNLEIENKYFYGKLSDYIEEIDNKTYVMNSNFEKTQSKLDELRQLNNVNISNYHELSDRLNELSDRLNELSDRLNELPSKLSKLSNELPSKLAELANKLSELESVREIPTILEADKESYLSKAVEASSIPYADLKEKQDKNTFYHLFGNIFRGQREDIKNRQEYYLKYVLNIIDQSDGKLFLDAGCGRGEFLELLKENNIPYLGIDTNELEMNFLKERGLNVVKADILEYLSSTSHNLIGISSFQVIEHLEFEYIKKFIELAYDRIGYNGIIILESVNPHCPYALSHFYLDTTHIRPYPPETIKFLLEWYGFKDVKIIFSALIEEKIRSKDLSMNYQDYAVIGKKL